MKNDLLRMAARYGLTLAILLSAVAGSSAATIYGPTPEHTIWVNVETEPNGAVLYAPPAEEDEIPNMRLGVTPCVIAVDLTWGRKWLKKRWELISVRSPGNVCHALLNENNDYDLRLDLIAARDGYDETAVDRRILTLKNPGKKWERKILWPKNATINIPLQKGGTQSDGAAAESGTRKVILANSRSGTEGDSAGTLTILANVEDAQVFVDRKYIGTAPVQVVLKGGSHVIQVQKTGHYPVRRDIVVNDDAEVAYRADLIPLAE